MNIEKTITSLEKNGYIVSFFHTSEEAVRYLESSIQKKTIGFGGSRTLTDLDLHARLSKNNVVLNPDFPEDGETFISTAMKSLDTEYYILSANGLSEDGVIVNIDAAGNRLSSSLFGHKKVYYVIGTNKITENIEQAVWRARNVAAPKNALRYRLNTPCVVMENKCYDCQNERRLCNSLLIHFKKIASCEVEIVLIDEELGF